MTVGERIKKELQEQGWSQADFAKEIGISKVSLCNSLWEIRYQLPPAEQKIEVAL